eukprot:10900095-Alexandrium_andersonii.AAC.1
MRIAAPRPAGLSKPQLAPSGPALTSNAPAGSTLKPGRLSTRAILLSAARTPVQWWPGPLR